MPIPLIFMISSKVLNLFFLRYSIISLALASPIPGNVINYSKVALFIEILVDKFISS